MLGAEAGAHQHRLLAQRLDELAPDVVCLQEARRPLVCRLRRRVPALVSATFVSKRRERRPPWMQEGLATIAARHAKPARGHDLDGGRRVAVESVHDVGGARVHVFNVHFHTEAVERARNVVILADLCARRRAEGGTPIVVGDLNTKPRAAEHPDRAYDALRAAGFVDAFALDHPDAADHECCPGVAGTSPTVDECVRCGYTNWHDARHPSGRVGPPHQRLDYVLVPDDGSVEVLDVFTPRPNDAAFDGYRPISDHLPVIADLRVASRR
ncbi:MAG TPA: endonuclease/exonuclease/phosphatase family protein [Acidimicrobiia bacterium]|nr:endonuclease/exonuclease/phosphatase family protein [Acidimicrobiia bacterium]